MKHTIKEEITGVLTFVGIIWGVFLIDFVVPGDFTDWGLVPRTIWGLIGIPLAPFLHGGFSHIFSNTIPLVILLVLLAGSRTRTWPTVIEITLLGGALLWLLGRGGNETSRIAHVGASGLIYGLIAFLIVAGFREKRMVPMIVAIVVGFLYGTTLLTGVLPSLGKSHISWDGHLFGAIAGIAIAFLTVPTAGTQSSQPDESPLGQTAD